MTTLLERIEWVLKHRADVVKNKNQWALKAKLERQRVHTMVDRLKKDPDADFEREALRSLADAAEVSRGWFAWGEGSPDPLTSRRQERYRQMSAVRDMARAQGFDEDFVRTYEAHLDADEEPDAEYLWTLMKAAYARHTRKRAREPGDPLEGLDDTPKKKR